MGTFIITLLICSVTMSLLGLIFMALTPLLARRYSTKWVYYAWLVVIIGFIIPFRPTFNSAIIQVDVPTVISADAKSGLPTYIPTGNSEGLLPPDNAPGQELNPGDAAVSGIPAVSGAPAASGNHTGSGGPTVPDALTVIPWETIIIAVWLGGAVVFIASQVMRHRRFIRSVWRWGKDVTDEQTVTVLDSIRCEMGIDKAICLQRSEMVGSPLLTGILYPRIMLPTVKIPDSEMALILKHELVHYKRKDVWYKGLVLFAVALHWFNPIAYLFAKKIGLQCEKSCDDEVIKYKDADARLHYSETIINSIRSAKPATALSTTFYGGKKEMKSRITSIMDMGRKKRGLIIICLVLLLTLVTGLAFAVNSMASPEDVDEPADNSEEVDIDNTDDILESEIPDPAPAEEPDTSVIPGVEGVSGFLPEDIYDLVLVELVLYDGSVISVDNSDSLRWFETYFGSAVEVDYEPDFHETGFQRWAEMYFTRSDGTVGIVYPYLDAELSPYFRSGGIDYEWGEGDKTDFFGALLPASDYDPMTSPLFGILMVQSGGVRYEAYAHLMYGIGDEALILRRPLITLEPEDVADELKPINVEDDLQVITEGGRCGGGGYWMYDVYKLVDGEWVEVVISSGSSTELFSIRDIPSEPGEYILRIWKDWGYAELYRGSARYLYFFKLIV